MVKKDKGGPGALSPAQRKRDKLPCLAMSKENFRLPVCLRRAGLKTVNGLAVPVKRMPLDLNLGAEKLDICGSDSAADVSAVGRGLPSSELGFKGSSTESSAGIAVDAASGRAVQSAKSKGVVQKRGVRWGPFLLSPIVPQGGQTGWGAICGLHHNRGDGSGSRCKKALSMGRLSHSACILRLKRWLLAGLNDAELSVQNARSDHVAMGGPGLQAFAEEGPSEEEMDEKIRQYTASSL